VKGPHTLFLISAAVSVLVFIMHRANISRIANGTEPRIGAREKSAA
jgi:glycerol-3-phosphate acyltransferase PlsY